MDIYKVKTLDTATDALSYLVSAKNKLDDTGDVDSEMLDKVAGLVKEARELLSYFIRHNDIV